VKAEDEGNREYGAHGGFYHRVSGVSRANTY
jgi:hypothetical protein